MNYSYLEVIKKLLEWEQTQEEHRKLGHEVAVICVWVDKNGRIVELIDPVEIIDDSHIGGSL